MKLILVPLEVSKEDKSKFVNFLQLVNIPPKSITCCVLKKLNVTYSKDSQL